MFSTFSSISIRVRRAVAGILFLASSLVTAWAQTNYPASAATLANGATLHPCADCGGAEEIVHIGGTNGGTATFSQVVAPTAGLYQVTVSFNNNDDSSYLITVNTNTQLDGIFF